MKKRKKGCRKDVYNIFFNGGRRGLPLCVDTRGERRSLKAVEKKNACVVIGISFDDETEALHPATIQKSLARVGRGGSSVQPFSRPPFWVLSG